MKKETIIETQETNKYLDKNAKESQLNNQENSLVNNKKEKIEKDPTRFGDWEVNGRAIDF